MKILITGATGMFGGALINHLSSTEHDHIIKALVRNKEKAQRQGIDKLKNVEIIEGDLEKPNTILAALEGIDRVFLVTPMVPNLDQMEINFIEAAKQQNVKQIFKLYGAVEHKGDSLIQLHNRAVDALKHSGLDWTLLSPNSVMDTSLLPQADNIRRDNAIYGCTGHHKIGMVALQDVVTAAAILLTTAGHSGKDYQLTGPDSLSLYEISDIFSDCLQRKINYIDMPEEDFEAMLIKFTDKTPKQIDMEIMCHMRAWNQDGADLVTDTYKKIIGKDPTSIAGWINQNIKKFE